jgi:hypothetical protein
MQVAIARAPSDDDELLAELAPKWLKENNDPRRRFCSGGEW